MTEKLINQIVERVLERAERLGLSERQVSLSATGKPDTIRNWRGKGVLPRLDTLMLVARALDTTPEWLAFAAGDNSVTRVPKISFVQAGHFAQTDTITSADDFSHRIEIAHLPPGDWYAFDVEGDSMDRISPPGSTIIVNRLNKGLVSNACYVVLDGEGGSTYKRFRANPVRFEPVSTNPAHEPFYLDESGMPEIFGRVFTTMLRL